GQSLQIPLQSAAGPFHMLYTVKVESEGYYVANQLGLQPASNYPTNLNGLSEKWLPATGGKWYYITPDGAVYKYKGTGPVSNSQQVAKVGVEFYNNPDLFHQSQAGAATATVSDG